LSHGKALKSRPGILARFVRPDVFHDSTPPCRSLSSCRWPAANKPKALSTASGGSGHLRCHTIPHLAPHSLGSSLQARVSRRRAPRCVVTSCNKNFLRVIACNRSQSSSLPSLRVSTGSVCSHASAVSIAGVQRVAAGFSVSPLDRGRKMRWPNILWVSKTDNGV